MLIFCVFSASEFSHVNLFSNFPAYHWTNEYKNKSKYKKFLKKDFESRKVLSQVIKSHLSFMVQSMQFILIYLKFSTVFWRKLWKKFEINDLFILILMNAIQTYHYFYGLNWFKNQNAKIGECNKLCNKL